MWIYFPKFVVSKPIDVFFLSYWTKAASGQMNANQLCDRPWNSNFSKTNFNHLRHLLSIYFTYILVKRATIYRFSNKLKKKKYKKNHTRTEALFQLQVWGLQPVALLKRRVRNRSFSVNYVKYFMTAFSEHFRGTVSIENVIKWLLLTRILIVHELRPP